MSLCFVNTTSIGATTSEAAWMDDGGNVATVNDTVTEDDDDNDDDCDDKTVGVADNDVAHVAIEPDNDDDVGIVFDDDDDGEDDDDADADADDVGDDVDSLVLPALNTVALLQIFAVGLICSIKVSFVIVALVIGIVVWADVFVLLLLEIIGVVVAL